MAKEKIDFDEELTKELKQAKRKARNFAIFANGTKCVKLIVSRKKIPAGQLVETKKEYKAKKIYKGVCEGEGGPGMVFRVAEQPTVGLVKFRVYLQEATGMMIKPRFEIIEGDIIEVDEIGDATDEQVAAGVDTEVTPKGDSAKVSSNDPPNDPKMNRQKKQLVGALAKVVPAVKRVLQAPDSDTQTKHRLNRLVGDLKTAVGEGNMDSAKQAVAQIVPLVKQAGDGLSPTSPGDPSQEMAQNRDSIDEEQKSNLRNQLQERVRVAKGKTETNLAPFNAEFSIYMTRPQALVDAVNTRLNDLYDKILADLTSTLERGSRAEIERTVEAFRGQVANDPIVVHLRRAQQKVGVDPRVEDIFSELFDGVIGQL